jgi:hypothetical protein
VLLLPAAAAAGEAAAAAPAGKGARRGNDDGPEDSEWLLKRLRRLALNCAWLLLPAPLPFGAIVLLLLLIRDCCSWAKDEVEVVDVLE